jgi:4-hydroxy-2-oxoheptanedioate aldolase
VIKQHLDIGVRNLMVPMIDTPEQAAGLVRSVRYPQAGRRGVASSTTRASRFGREPNYLADAHKGLFVIAQIETPAALANAAAIAGTEGIDAIFIGPGDLSANLGFLGRTGEPAVREAVAACMATCKAAGVPVGTLVGSVADAALYAAMGADFVAIGSDVGLLSQGADRVVAEGRAAMARR